MHQFVQHAAKYMYIADEPWKLDLHCSNSISRDRRTKQNNFLEITSCYSLAFNCPLQALFPVLQICMYMYM